MQSTLDIKLLKFLNIISPYKSSSGTSPTYSAPVTSCPSSLDPAARFRVGDAAEGLDTTMVSDVDKARDPISS